MIPKFNHLSVLLEPSIQYLCSDLPGLFLDCTLGGGGHTEAILKVNPDNRVIGIDRDPQAIQAATARLASFGDRFSVRHGSFAEVLPTLEDESFQGIIMDLGVSSPQIDQADRGFSFQKDGPLDMRMNPEQGCPASEWLNQVTETELANVIYRFGEEPRSRRIAKAIIEGRPFSRTLELAELVKAASKYHGSKNHPATRTFQAIRIALNDELTQISNALPIAFQKLKINGHLGVISFHSLEDRLVKRFFQEYAAEKSEKDQYGNPLSPVLGKRIVRKGISGKKADASNPRARSARLRILKKLPL